MSRTTVKGIAASLLLAATAGTAACAMDVAWAAARDLRTHDKKHVTVEERLKNIEVKLDEHTRTDAEGTAETQRQLLEIQRSLGRIEGRQDR